MTSAICLAEFGFAVQIITRDQPDGTTSCAAGALWGPYLFEDERVLPWSELTRQKLVSIAAEGDVTGVRCVLGLEAARVPAPVPKWATELPGFRTATAEELPGFHNGWWYEAPLVDMPAYLKYLEGRLADLDVIIETGEVRRLDADTAQGRILVNCTGIGALRLTGDPLLTPTRGQLVVVPNPGIDRFFAEHDESPDPVYFLPHGDQLVLGGSIQPGITDLTPDLRIAEEIQARCAEIEPRVKGLTPLYHRVGIRPSRPVVRLEHERTGDGIDVVHNYGHGGAGVTTSWGCADDVARIAGGL